MKTGTKIYIALGLTALIVISGLTGAAISNHRIARLENEVEMSRQKADEAQQRAAARDMETAAYKQKIDYLEAQAASLKEKRREQDEKQKVLESHSRDARIDVARTRSKRADDTTVDELCRKLASAGHPCG